MATNLVIISIICFPTTSFANELWSDVYLVHFKNLFVWIITGRIHSIVPAGCPQTGITFLLRDVLIKGVQNQKKFFLSFNDIKPYY